MRKPYRSWPSLAVAVLVAACCGSSYEPDRPDLAVDRLHRDGAGQPVRRARSAELHDRVQVRRHVRGEGRLQLRARVVHDQRELADDPAGCRCTLVACAARRRSTRSSLQDLGHDRELRDRERPAGADARPTRGR